MAVGSPRKWQFSLAELLAWVTGAAILFSAIKCLGAAWPWAIAAAATILMWRIDRYLLSHPWTRHLCLVALTVLYWVCGIAVSYQLFDYQWPSFLSILAVCSLGSLWGIKGSRFAVLGAIFSGLIGTPLAAILLEFVNALQYIDWQQLGDALKHLPQVFFWVGLIGAVAGTVFGGSVATVVTLLSVRPLAILARILR
ncbi:MAG: hypothetical protein ABSG53_33680 [Thermoguttaceae bacterium]|jgi:hypothetical protein